MKTQQNQQQVRKWAGGKVGYVMPLLCSPFLTFSLSHFLLCACLLRAENAIPEPNPLVWDALEKNSDLPAMTNITYFTFWVTNTSTADAAILSTETSCDCAVVEANKILPWHIAPGEGGPLKVRLNTRGNFGLVTKTVTVRSSHGPQVLTMRLKIPITPAHSNVSVRKQDQMAAQADRQAVFRGSCAACHTSPAAGQVGEGLFVKACGICHTAEHRAEMVPDLVALKHDTDAGYWRTWITHGKVGSLMPAFAQSEGGILDTNQIESLVEYLVKKYPARNVATSDISSTPDHHPSTNTNHGQASVPPLPASQAKIADDLLPQNRTNRIVP